MRKHGHVRVSGVPQRCAPHLQAVPDAHTQHLADMVEHLFQGEHRTFLICIREWWDVGLYFWTCYTVYMT